MFHLISFSKLYFSKRNYKDLIMKAIAYGLFISPFKKYLLSTNFAKTSWYGLILERNSYQDFFYGNIVDLQNYIVFRYTA